MSHLSKNDAPAIETYGLGKRFGGQWAVDAIDLRVEPGEIYGFLGCNGAGKTTAIRLILGLLRPTCGIVRVFNHDVVRDRRGAARHTGSLLDARATYDHLSGRENLDCTRRLLGLSAKEIDRVLEIVDMSADANRRMAHYSLGMRQRLGLARALLGEPRLLVLDEPMNGLDPDGIRDMRAAISHLPERSGVTVFLSSHLLSEVEQVATHIGLMHDGRLVRQGPIGELLGQASPELFLRTGDVPRALRILHDAGYSATPDGDGVRVDVCGSDAEAAVINRGLIESGLEVAELAIRGRTLETLYMQTRHDRKEAA
ncbi:ABC transporter ATP-binding protein [Sphingomonas sp. ERG5]|uniref:ABC transporter ATP-binding protein n=1 Tax=Sphingomonas sp. ERG5 TaxID=1381597 RepID=UPI00054C4D3C|nr:ATP-binding cassette domain-containing protein [Sphingomonas sp. ERG5]